MIRAVRYTPPSEFWLGVALWAAVTGMVLYATVGELRQNYLFAYHAQSADATVERKYEMSSHGRGGTTYTPHLHYHYEADAIVFHSTATVKDETFESVMEGGTIPILYLSDYPAHNRIELPAEIAQVRLITLLACAASIFFVAVGAWRINYFVRRNGLYQYLVTNGLCCDGSVLAIHYDSTGRYQSIKKYYLAFTFCDDRGNEQTGRTWHLNSGEENGWQAGSRIQVYFDPSNSKRFTVELNPDESGR